MASVTVTVRANLNPVARDDAMTAPGVLLGYSDAGVVVE